MRTYYLRGPNYKYIYIQPLLEPGARTTIESCYAMTGVSIYVNRTTLASLSIAPRAIRQMSKKIQSTVAFIKNRFSAQLRQIPVPGGSPFSGQCSIERAGVEPGEDEVGDSVLASNYKSSWNWSNYRDRGRKRRPPPRNASSTTIRSTVSATGLPPTALRSGARQSRGGRPSIQEEISCQSQCHTDSRARVVVVHSSRSKLVIVNVL